MERPACSGEPSCQLIGCGCFVGFSEQQRTGRYGFAGQGEKERGRNSAVFSFEQVIQLSVERSRLMKRIKV